MNGGSCQVKSTGGYLCICSSGYNGLTCQNQLQTSNCADSPCLNSGTCSTNSQGYFCACMSNFYGLNCQYQVTSQTCLTGDQNSNSCKSWANLGFCSFAYIYNSVPVPIYCPMSCGLCTTISGCFDTQERCSTWAQSGYCNSIDANLCNKSCNLCAVGV